MNIKTRNTLTVFFTLLMVGSGIYIPIQPTDDEIIVVVNEINIYQTIIIEETNMTNIKIPQFEEVSSTNDDLEDNSHIKNIGKYEGYYYWGAFDGNDFKIYKTDSITGTTSTYYTYSFTGPISNIYNIWVRILYTDGDWVLFASCTFDDSSDSITRVFMKNLTDDLSWVVGIDGVSLTLGYVSYVDAFVLDESDNYIYFIKYEDNVTPEIYLYKYEMNGGSYGTGTSVAHTSISLDDYGVWAGYTDYSSNTYYLILSKKSVGMERWKATSSTIAKDSSLTISKPSNCNMTVQQYWKQENVEIVMDEDHLYTRVGSGDWQSRSETGTTTNAIIWEYDSNNKYKIAYIVWKDAIYEVLPGGGLGKIQIFYDDAYVGWEDWFANGSDKIYQISYTGTRYGHTMNIREVHIKELSGEAEMTDGTDDAPITVDWGTWYEPDLSDWTDSSGTDCEVSIVKEIGGHKNVMQLDDQNGSAYAIISKSFSGQSDGEIEMFVRSDDVTKASQFFIYDGSTSNSIDIRLYNSRFEYYDGAAFQNIVAASSDTWYHLRIVFDCSSNWTIYIDGAQYGPYGYYGSPSAMDNIQFNTGTSSNPIKFYIDALGFSWEGYITYSNYRRMWEKGDLIPIYDPNDELVFKGFVESIIDGDYHTRKVNLVAPWKLDLTKKITYSISASAPDTFFPAIASANFEFSTFDVASGGNNYTRDWKNTELLPKIKEVIKRENWVWYAGPDQIIHLDDGTERAIIDYKRGTGTLTWGTSINPDLSDWMDSSGTDCEVSVVDVIDGHKNVMQLYDNSASDICDIRFSFDDQTTGIIEMFVRTTDITKQAVFGELMEGTSSRVYIWIDNGKFQYYQSGNHDIVAATNNTFYHIKITFDCSTDTFHIEINGVDYGPYTFNSAATTINKLKLRTNVADNGYYLYVDALGFSWDSYKTYRTLYPFCRSVGAKITKITPKNSRLSVSKAIVTGKIVNGIPTEGSYTNNEVRFGKIVRDSIPDEESKSVLDLIAQALVINRDTEFLQVVCTVYSMSPVRWGRQIYFDYPERRDKFTDLGAPALYYVNKSETWVVGGYQKLSISDSLIFPSEKKRVREGTGIKEVDTGGINPENNDRRIQDVESKTTWTWRDPNAYDFTKTDLTDDTNWNDLDLSSIVGSKKSLVSIRCVSNDDVAGSSVSFRMKGHSLNYVNPQFVAYVANINHINTFLIETDSDGKIEIKCSPKPTDWSTVSIVVRGYRDA